MNFIREGKAHGNVAMRLLQSNGDPLSLRPYVGNDGRVYVSRIVGFKDNQPIFNKQEVVGNATATLRKDEWKILDTAVVKAAKPRLKFVADLRSKGLTYNLNNGLAKTILETETQGEIQGASISMDGLRKGQGDRPEYELSSLPLPIIHKDFDFSLRQILNSRNGSTPLDTTMVEMAGRKVAEEAEKLALGTASSYTYGGGTVYGLTNFPSRITSVSGTLPTTSGWTGATLLTEVLAMRQAAQDAYHYGPYTLYVSSKWDEYLDQDYSASKGDNSVRERIAKVNGITAVTTLDYLNNYDMILVQDTTDVMREVVGMDITTIQWESEGGMRLHFKVMAILVPQARADQNGNTGIVHVVPS